ncbi:MAG: hypothetical protein V4580_11165 [Bacteroidota bacterium]
MFPFIENLYAYYYIIIILQGLCVFHSIKRGTQSKWLWLIVFLPVIGCVIYIFTEIIQKRHLSGVQSSIQSIANPGGKISDLEKKFKFSDTFTNRVALADIYLQNGTTEKAIELYEPALKGVFIDNEHVIKQLIHAYHITGEHHKVVALAPKVLKSFEFSKTRANLLYALSLVETGDTVNAEREFIAMDHRFSNYEARYHYGDFLLKQNRKEDAAMVFHEIVEESQHLSRKEKGNSTSWIDKSKKVWQNLMDGK